MTDLQTETEYYCWAEVIRLEQTKKYTAESEFRASALPFLERFPCQDILNLEHEDVIDDVVFAVVRTTDKDEAQEIYLIVNND